jgi:2-dehydro-3-deoxyphosphogluconate aldolase/(4S)-4-hydroxy-2-oxoglutarate aldolase
MAQASTSLSLDQILSAAPVIPVLVIDRVEDAAPIARALIAGGLPVLEVTLRTPVALEAIAAMKRVPGAIVGAGTVLDPAQLDAARAAGADFIVSPGLTEPLALAAIESGLPFLPGVATASEVMRARDLGFSRLKFFPAEAAGGLPALQGLAAVFGGVRFCPTGGITQDNAWRWLDHPAVACVGGSWLAPAGASVDEAAIRRRAEAAASLRRA